MQIETFLLDRIAEAEAQLELCALPENWKKELKILCENQREILRWHKDWPILMESQPELEWHRGTLDMERLTYQMSLQIQWLTQDEYRRKFGKEPPTAPLLRRMVREYMEHPDYQEEWLTS